MRTSGGRYKPPELEIQRRNFMGSVLFRIKTALGRCDRESQRTSEGNGTDYMKSSERTSLVGASNTLSQKWCGFSENRC